MTLAGGSRQVVMEGEPVTRHVFKVIRDSGTKPVYGLFIAKEVNPNTVDAFHNARYWSDWESSITTPVISIEIEHALSLVRAIQKKMITIEALRKLFDSILDKQKEYLTGPEWYRAYTKNLSEQFE